MDHKALYHRAARAGERLDGLLVEALRIAQTLDHGIHGRRRSGLGETFHQYRSYQAGDSIAQVDWRRSAKDNHTYIRQREWEAMQSVWLWCDNSGSMHYQSAKSGGESPHATESKYARAALLTVALAVLLVRGGEQAALYNDPPMYDGLPMRPANTQASLQHMATVLSDAITGEHAPLASFSRPIPNHGGCVLFGDFLESPSRWQQVLKGLSHSGGVKGCLVRIIDPLEDDISLMRTGAAVIHGCEGEDCYHTEDTATLVAAYREAWSAHGRSLRKMCRDVGWQYAEHRTDAPPQAALYRLYDYLRPTR